MYLAVVGELYLCPLLRYRYFAASWKEVTMPHSVDSVVAAVRRTYEMRDSATPWSDWKRNIYHPRHSLGRLFRDHNRSALVRALNTLDLTIDHIRMLDVGCGYGAWLRTFVELGADPTRLSGIDLMPERIAHAFRTNRMIHWAQAEASALPFADCSFDMVLQSVVFSSVPDDALRRRMAAEMFRVCDEGGHIVWIDHKRPSGLLAGFDVPSVTAYFPGTVLRYGESVHPRYFRLMHRQFDWLAELIYRVSRFGCESWLLILQKTSSQEARLP